ncbi:MAG: tRNA pseudouridine(13) synthase TruD [Nitrososphaerota archaeon]|nr:tRNA pseudouridine(13) synthase TruD [Aigarchaeota archaeon]MDW8077178.1 tRNA pseudouridine(13) synthase TruD [Nitrososphaerota archaeon]
MILSKLQPKDVECFIGIEGYATKSEGVGGVIKESPNDFMVWEVLKDGSDAKSMFETSFSTNRYGKFLVCVLHKVDVDTISTLSLISRLIGVKPREVGICGIKDRRACSWQFITIPNKRTLDLNETVQLTERVWLRRVSTRDFKLSSGELYRNMFEIKISKLRLDGHLAAALMGKTIEELKLKGAPNFFGHQRFGVSRPITHVIGKLIVKGMLKEAVEEFIMDYTTFEPKVIREARMKLAESWNPKDALRYLPKRLFYERAMAKCLEKNPQDYVGAFRRLPLRLRRLFVEAYSSYIFNKCLSKLLAGNSELLMPSTGDLVIELDIHGSPTCRPFILHSGALPRALSLAQAGKLSTLIPVPGYRVRLPNNEKRDVLEEVLEEEDVKLEDFTCRALPEAASVGSYRAIVMPSWEFKTYNVGEDYLWVRLSLPSGCYATVLLRELMKPENALYFEGHSDKYSA